MNGKDLIMNAKNLINNLLQKNKIDLILKKLKENKSFIEDAIQNSLTINKRRIEYEMNKPSHEDHEVSENNFLYGFAMTDKELINYVDDLILVNNNDDGVYPYTESDVPPNKFTYTKNDIRVDENGKKIYLHR